MEIRFRSLDVECRDDGTYKIGGYVNVTERESELLYSGKRGKWFNEVVRQGAFTRSLQSGKEIPLLLEHDYEKRLADNTTNTLTLTEDQIGLRFDAEIRDKDVYEKVKSKQINNCSFGFVPIDQEYESVTNLREKRYLNDLELLEISLVENPAYAGSLVEVRNLTQKEQETAAEVEETEEQEVVETEVKEETTEVENNTQEEAQEEEKAPEIKVAEEEVEEQPTETEDNENRGYIDQQINNIVNENNSTVKEEIVDELIKEKEEQLEIAEMMEDCVKEDLEQIKKSNEEYENYVEEELLRRNMEVLKLRVQLLKLKSI